MSVLAWIGILNTIYASFIVAKWAPGSASRQALVFAETGPICQFSLWADTFNFYALVTLNTLIAATLYLSICMKKDLTSEQHPAYFWGYVTFFWVVTIVAPLAITYAPGFSFNNGVCSPSTQTSDGAYAPLFLLIVIQLYCVVRSTMHAGKIISAAKSLQHSKRDIRLLYMLVRFSATIVAEMLSLVPYFTLNYYGVKPSILRVVCVCTPLAGVLDGIILLFGNKPLVKLVMRKLRLITKSDLSSSSSDRTDGREKTVSVSNMTRTPVSTNTQSNSGGIV